MNAPSVSYRFEWISGAVLLGAVLLLLIVPHFALSVLVWVVVLSAIVALAALAGAMLAMSNLLVRSLRRRLAKAAQSPTGARPVAADEGDLDYRRRGA